MSTEIAPFKADIPESDLADLRRRLVTARWPEKETVDDWSQGAPLRWIRDVCRYWAEEYELARARGRGDHMPVGRTASLPPSLISRLHRKTRLGESPWRRAT